MKRTNWKRDHPNRSKIESNVYPFVIRCQLILKIVFLTNHVEERAIRYSSFWAQLRHHEAILKIYKMYKDFIR